MIINKIIMIISLLILISIINYIVISKSKFESNRFDTVFMILTGSNTLVLISILILIFK